LPLLRKNTAGILKPLKNEKQKLFDKRCVMWYTFYKGEKAMKKWIRTFVMAVFFVSSLFIGAKGIQASTGTKLLSNNDKKGDLLVLKHAREMFSQKKDGSMKLAWHESHYSHSSHASHSSHYSHYSGY